MKNETIEVLEKNRIEKTAKSNSASGCCGGEAKDNKDACCKLDEDKKAEGESGCGCNSEGAKKAKNSCC